MTDFKECMLNWLSQQSKMSELNNIWSKYELSTVVTAWTSTGALSDWMLACPGLDPESTFRGDSDKSFPLDGSKVSTEIT